MFQCEHYFMWLLDLGEVPPNPQGARRVYRGDDLSSPPLRTPLFFALPTFWISYPLNFTFASVPASFILNNCSPARGWGHLHRQIKLHFIFSGFGLKLVSRRRSLGRRVRAASSSSCKVASWASLSPEIPTQT
jgi:hypothetical protein